jgi:hypothetical protein
LKIVPKDIGMTVWSRITVSFTRSCASTFSRVESSGAIGTSDTTAAMSRKLIVYTSGDCSSIPIGPNLRGWVARMMQ